MKKIINLSPQHAIILLATYAKSFENVSNAWPLLDLLISHGKDFLKDPNTGVFYINTLYYLCSSFNEYYQERLSYCVSKFILATKSKHFKICIAGYKALTKYLKIEYYHMIDFNNIIDSLSNRELVFPILDFLLVYLNLPKNITNDSLSIPVSYELIKILIENIQNDYKALILLLQLSENIDFARIILKFPVWIGSNSAFLPEDSFRILTSIMRHQSLRHLIIELPEIGFFFKKVAKIREPRILVAISSVIRRLPFNKNFLNILSEEGALKTIIKSAIKLGDNISLTATLTLILSLSDVQITPEFIMLADTLKNLLKDGTQITALSIAVITALTKDPLCMKKFSELHLGGYFKKLEKHPDYAEYSQKFFKNLAATEFQ